MRTPAQIAQVLTEPQIACLYEPTGRHRSATYKALHARGLMHNHMVTELGRAVLDHIDSLADEEAIND
jgi:hypothetical protein